MSKLWTLIGALAMGLMNPAFSAEEEYYRDVVQIVFAGPVHNTTLSIVGPGDYYAQAYTEAGIPVIQLSEYGKVVDGTYIWQVTAATDELIEVQDDGLRSRSTEHGNSSGTMTINKGTAESGSFRVQNGVILPKSKVTRE